MISEYEKRKCEKEMREFCQGSISVKDYVKIHGVPKIRGRKKKMGALASIARIISSWRHK